MGTALFCHRLSVLYFSSSITALYQMSTSQERCSQIQFSFYEGRSKCAYSMSSWSSLGSEVSVSHKTSSLCSRNISQFVLNLEFSSFLVCSISSCSDNIGPDKTEQKRSFLLLLNASLYSVSVGHLYCGFQLCSVENFIGTRSSCLPVHRVLWLVGPCYQPHTVVSDAMQKLWVLCKLIVCPNIKLKIVRNFNTTSG